MSRRLFVNPSGFDDVGQVLSRLGQGFEYEASTEYKSGVPAESVVFLNCGGASPSAQDIRSFVEAGGTIYASDLQAPLVASAFGAIFEARGGSGMGVRDAQIIDQGLARVVSERMKLNFNLAGWQYLHPRRDSEVRTLVVTGSLPVVVAWDAPGGGSVLFTAFHNVRQDDKAQNELMRFLLFRPMLARKIQEQARAFEKVPLAARREYTSGLGRGTPTREFLVDGAGPVTASLVWNGQGRLALSLLSSDGKPMAQKDAWTGPITISATVPSGAKVRVQCVEFVQSELPFSLTVAPGAAGAAASSAAPAGPATASPAPKPATPATAAVRTTLHLRGSNGAELQLSVSTRIGGRALRPLGDEHRFVGEHQFDLSPDGSGGWWIEPSAGTSNATILNGSACTDRVRLKVGDEVCVGNAATGNFRMRMKIDIR